ncbi:MAG: HAMP domain-containing histidine kinase [Candidatus Eremiobacteraeota bacterium]|nr:HAMP domain-containing histidine kinase [Candidatus Eremiobacteraeota bacterium]
MKNGTLRAQITLVYTVALILGLLLFAALSLLILDSTARSTLDQRLLADARTLRAVLEVHDGRIQIDETDRAQFARIIGVRVSGAVYDAHGNLLATSTTPVPSVVRAVVARGGAAQQLVTVGAGINRVRVATLPIVDHARPIGAEVLWRSVDSIQDLDQRAALIFAVAVPAIVLFAVLFGNMIEHRGLARLRLMADIASEIEARDLSRRLGVRSQPDELGRLCAAFDRMLDRLEAAFERERRFTADASHELRGPLSVIKAEADLSLRRARSSQEYRRTLHTILEESSRLELLTSDLLASARTQPQSASSKQYVNLGIVVQSVGERLKILAQARNIKIHQTLCAACTVHGNQEDLTRVAFAVLHNAVKYCSESGTVEVLLERSNESVSLTVTDDGHGFSADALKNAFDRFWRDNGMRDREGTGLGLSIAQGIVRGVGGSITLRNRDERRGAVVVVQFPCSDAPAKAVGYAENPA